MSDPKAVEEALDEAIDAFNMAGQGRPTPESDIDTDDDWKTQLTKGCRLLAAVGEIQAEGYYTATVELSFGIIERSLEAFAIAEGGDELHDFPNRFTRSLLRPGGEVWPLFRDADRRSQKTLR